MPAPYVYGPYGYIYQVYPRGPLSKQSRRLEYISETPSEQWVDIRHFPAWVGKHPVEGNNRSVLAYDVYGRQVLVPVTATGDFLKHRPALPQIDATWGQGVTSAHPSGTNLATTFDWASKVCIVLARSPADPSAHLPSNILHTYGYNQTVPYEKNVATEIGGDNGWDVYQLTFIKPGHLIFNTVYYSTDYGKTVVEWATPTGDGYPIVYDFLMSLICGDDVAVLANNASTNTTGESRKNYLYDHKIVIQYVIDGDLLSVQKTTITEGMAGGWIPSSVTPKNYPTGYIPVDEDILCKDDRIYGHSFSRVKAYPSWFSGGWATPGGCVGQIDVTGVYRRLYTPTEPPEDPPEPYYIYLIMGWRVLVKLNNGSVTKTADIWKESPDIDAYQKNASRKGGSFVMQEYRYLYLQNSVRTPNNPYWMPDPDSPSGTGEFWNFTTNSKTFGAYEDFWLCKDKQGSTWTKITPNMGVTTNSNTYRGMAAHWQTENIAYMALYATHATLGSGLYIIRTEDGGENWEMEADASEAPGVSYTDYIKSMVILNDSIGHLAYDDAENDRNDPIYLLMQDENNASTSYISRLYRDPVDGAYKVEQDQLIFPKTSNNIYHYRNTSWETNNNYQLISPSIWMDYWGGTYPYGLMRAGSMLVPPILGV